MNKLMEIPYKFPTELVCKKILEKADELKKDFAEIVKQYYIFDSWNDKEKILTITINRLDIKLFFVILHNNIVVYEDTPIHLKILTKKYNKIIHQRISRFFDEVKKSCKKELNH